MTRIADLSIKIFADGANLDDMLELASNPLIKGFTTNPTLMRKDGVTDYETFARSVLEVITDHPVSFEVFADDAQGMLAQARVIASWGPNVNVKIPITNTKGQSMISVVETLAGEGVSLNITAMMTLDQVQATADVLNKDAPAIVSVFAGRVADSGVDPVPLMTEASGMLANLPKAELLWASPREVLNVFHAEQSGCHIITMTNDLLAKLSSVGKSLDQFSLETVQMFYRDATAAGYSIRT
jgi:transaldolase